MEHLFFIIALVSIILRFSAKKKKPKETFNEDPPLDPPEIHVRRYVPKEPAASVFESKVSADVFKQTAAPKKSRAGQLLKLLRKDGKNCVVLSEVLGKKF